MTSRQKRGRSTDSRYGASDYIDRTDAKVKNKCHVDDELNIR